jgi:hypothetical protein
MSLSNNPQALREDVLYAFAVEPIQGRDTLQRYLRDYPQYAAELVDLSYELSREVRENEGPLSDEDAVLIEKSWQTFSDSAKLSDRPVSLES